MTILGIDPGTTRVGWAVIEKTKNTYKLIDCGLIVTKSITPHPQKLQEIYTAIRRKIADYQPDYFSIEKLFFSKNVTTGMAVSEARGVILLAAQKLNISISEYTPMQVKKSVTGYGKASKIQVQKAVKLILKLTSPPKPDDVADACAIAICNGNYIKNAYNL